MLRKILVLFRPNSILKRLTNDVGNLPRCASFQTIARLLVQERRNCVEQHWMSVQSCTWGLRAETGASFFQLSSSCYVMCGKKFLVPSKTRKNHVPHLRRSTCLHFGRGRDRAIGYDFDTVSRSDSQLPAGTQGNPVTQLRLHSGAR
jgi:hypothetical protein